jgi:predicted nuclease of predicted toxin-antitoxin system
MKLKLDENLPESLLSDLSGLGHDVDNVRIEGLAGSHDAAIWRAAQEAQRILITQDMDFGDVRRFMPGTHHGLILVRLRRPGRLALARRIRSVFTTESVWKWDRCFVLVTDLKVRVHSSKE